MIKRRSLTTFMLSICLVVVSAIMAVSIARYIRTANADDESATVAKFGVTLTWSEDGLFSNSYSSSQGINKVQMQDSAKGVAPGTEGSTTLTIGGQSEVAVEISFSMNLTYTGWTLKDSTEYTPITFTITEGNKYLQDNGEFGTTENTFTMNEMKNKTASLGIILAGANLSKTYTISWKWEAQQTLPAESYYICTEGIGTYNVGDVITADTYNYMLDENEALKFEETTNSSDLDMYLATLTPAPYLSVALSATAMQVIN